MRVKLGAEIDTQPPTFFVFHSSFFILHFFGAQLVLITVGTESSSSIVDSFGRGAKDTANFSRICFRGRDIIQAGPVGSCSVCSKSYPMLG